MGCVYCATNRLNGKRYVGKTVQSMAVRIESHRVCAARGVRRVFYSAIRKYGFDSFDWEVLFEGKDEEILFKVEQICIRDFGSVHPNGYNMTQGGEGITRACPEVGRKISKALTGRVVSEQAREKLRRPCPQSKKDKLSDRYLGKSYEERYGAERADEERRKRRISRSAALKKKWQDPEYRAKLVGKKRPCTESRKQALRDYHRRKKEKESGDGNYL